MECMWCQDINAYNDQNIVYWELPDGTRSIEILNTPCVICKNCGMEYQEESIINEIEDQLVLINTNQIENSISFEELMAIQRLLKKNYFR
ncbi:YokU family protein [Ferdinandcohnia quinoae]|uniref:YokU family protein n=1 Tax=Fredinandcohnia quinoae TaxID=2918902 RepID=A0AAW5E8J7_9BACI|nr:YokU family protein [Fredinandcohnia sp. SECRCQ15]MCH1626346.1 YokU family protein [Fredinandcohnia sp. SECRCQ15]